MLGIRLKSFLLGIMLIISCLEVQGHRQTCADFDQYCQMHSDCCSNSCLTYLYRCTRDYNGIYPYTFFGERVPTETTLENVLDLTFAGPVRRNPQTFQALNYGSHTTFRRYRQTTDSVNNQQMLSKDKFAADCKVIGLKCYIDDECCSKRCHGFLHQCVT